MKRIIYLLVLILFLASCSSTSTKGTSPTNEPTPPVTNTVSTLFTATPVPPSSTPIIGPTEQFITQVMGTKYAARTQYAALPTIPPTPTIPPNSPFCRPADLQTTFNSNGATQHIVLEVGVKNKGEAPCFLPSWPVVRLLDRSGKTLDITYDYIFLNSNPSSLPPTQESNPGKPILFGLAVNQSSGLALMWGNWCQPAIVGGVIIRMFLLETAGWIDIPTDIVGGGTCDDASSSSTIDVIGFGY
jgi:hypothetical protein